MPFNYSDTYTNGSCKNFGPRAPGNIVAAKQMAGKTPSLSLLVTYRERLAHLQILLPWLERVREDEGFRDFELILVEGSGEPSAGPCAAAYPWVRYEHILMPGPFHKTMLLNRAGSLARGDYLMIYDVDLLPSTSVLANHLALADGSPACLVTGYRVQLPEMISAAPSLPTPADLISTMRTDDAKHICPEDDYGALMSALLLGHLAGIPLCIPATAFRAVGGLNEDYIGWGPEDQDLIERLQDGGLTLVRATTLLYFHMPHEREDSWYDQKLIDTNRRRFMRREA